MRAFVAYLHGSELVARFQRSCGLFPRVDGNSLGCAGERDNAVGRRRGEVERSCSSQHGGCREEEASNSEYEVRNRPLHFLFLVSAALGSEVFYISFLPCIHWNLDPFLCRRLVNMWAVVMYVGQVLKDVLKLPRPLAPPVVKLEKRVDAEYGLPSTHAMAATALSFTLLLSAQERVQFQLEMGVFLAVLLSALVCLSRLYTGMHSALDVICGAAIAGVITISSYPLWQTLDQLQLHSPISPAVALLLPIFLCYRYPELGHYSTTRGDTTVILGAASGCWVGYWLNEQFGLTFEPSGPLPMPMSPVTINAFVLGVGRFMVGLSVLLCTRQTARWTSFAILCCFYGELQHDAKLKRRKEVEVPYYFSTYLTIGLMNTVLVNRLFVILGLL